MQEDEAMTRRALDLLGSRRNDRYDAALAALREDTRTWWSDTLTADPDKLEEDEEPFPPSIAQLLIHDLPCSGLIEVDLFGRFLAGLDKLQNIGGWWLRGLLQRCQASGPRLLLA